jgi:hypothetical protein
MLRDRARQRIRSANNAEAQVSNSLNGYGRGTIAFLKNIYPQIVPKTANQNNGLDRVVVISLSGRVLMQRSNGTRSNLQSQYLKNQLIVEKPLCR